MCLIPSCTTNISWDMDAVCPPHRRRFSPKVHGVTFQQPAIIVVAAVKDKVVSVKFIKTYRGRSGTAPHIRNLGIRWGWVVDFTPRPFYAPGKDSRYQGTGRAPKPGWTVLEKRKVSCPCQYSNPVPYSHRQSLYRLLYPGSNRGCENLRSSHEVGLIWRTIREGNDEIGGGRSSGHPECHAECDWRSSAKVSRRKKSERNKTVSNLQSSTLDSVCFSTVEAR